MTPHVEHAWHKPSQVQLKVSIPVSKERISQALQALEQHRDEFEGAADHLFFLQAVIATNLKNTGMPKDVYLDGCGKAWDIDDEPQETIPRNTH